MALADTILTVSREVFSEVVYSYSKLDEAKKGVLALRHTRCILNKRKLSREECVS